MPVKSLQKRSEQLKIGPNHDYYAHIIPTYRFVYIKLV